MALTDEEIIAVAENALEKHQHLSKLSFVDIKEAYGKDIANKLRYRFMKDLSGRILKHGKIFGGFVRDLIIHNHFAEKFYTEISEMETEENWSKLYNDTFFLPQYKDRLKLPNDIDCFMTTEELRKLSRALDKSNVYESCERELNIGEYFLHAPVHMKLTRLYVTLKHNPLYEGMLPSSVRMTVKVDVLHIGTEHMVPDMEPPFANIDFECNALILEGNGVMRLSNQITKHSYLGDSPFDQFNKLKSVVDDIIARVARPVKKANQFRVDKMFNNGWKIMDDKNLEYMFTLFAEDDPDDTCIVCCDTFSSISPQLKRSCCNGRYHKHCFERLIENENFNGMCPNCRAPMPKRNLVNRDVQMW